MSWKDGIKDAKDVIEEFIREYDALYDNQQYRINHGSGSAKLAIDYFMVTQALKRVKDALNDLQPPEVQKLSNC